MAHTMTPARRAALRKAQLASAQKRRGRRRALIVGGAAASGLAFHHATGVGVGRAPIVTAAAAGGAAYFATRNRSVAAHNRRINAKINKVEKRRVKRVTKHADIVQKNLYTHSVHGGTYANRRGVVAYNKATRINSKAAARKAKLKTKRR